MSDQTKQKSDVVVIGGGIFGNAIAYYYTRDNPDKKIRVLERNHICHGATSRAAALMTKIRAKKHFIPLSIETYRVIPEMEKLLGESLDIKKVGVLHVAGSAASVQALEELMEIAAAFDQPARYVNEGEAQMMAPWLNAREAWQIGYMPEEAYCDPYLLGISFARCAKVQGADIRQGVTVEDLIMEGNTVVGVTTNRGEFYADQVIIASGAWAPVLAARAGVGLPMAPVRSQYWITEKKDIFPEGSPIVLLPDAQAYARPEGGALLFGVREKRSFSVAASTIPEDLSEISFSADNGKDDLMGVIEKLARFFPAVYDIGLKYYIAGFSGYTPDNNLSMGKPEGVNHLLLATGCAGAGISVSGGVGLAFARMAAGLPNPYDFAPFSLERFGNIDPFSAEWLNRCAEARSRKLSG